MLIFIKEPEQSQNCSHRETHQNSKKPEIRESSVHEYISICLKQPGDWIISDHPLIFFRQKCNLPYYRGNEMKDHYYVSHHILKVPDKYADIGKEHGYGQLEQQLHQNDQRQAYQLYSRHSVEKQHESLNYQKSEQKVYSLGQSSSHRKNSLGQIDLGYYSAVGQNGIAGHAYCGAEIPEHNHSDNKKR